jgi:hypothetical protein
MAGAILLHFIHTPMFDESADEVFDAEDLRALQALIQANPEVGRRIQGTGGARKMRVGIAGRGKSYGARVIYYFQSAEDTVYLLLAYSKTEADDLSPAGREVLKEIIQQL